MLKLYCPKNLIMIYDVDVKNSEFLLKGNAITHEYEGKVVS